MRDARRILFVLGAFLLVTPQVTMAQGGRYDNPPDQRGRDNRLSGTYELDQRRSDDARLVVDRATRSLPVSSRDRVYQNWTNRLDAPETIALDVSGRSVSLMSANAPRVTFDADGRPRTEPGPYGSSVTTRADMRGNTLTVATTGSRGSDFTVTFQAVPGGLQITRRLDSEYQKTSVTVRSYYRRTAEPDWNVYHGRDRALVPEGTQLVTRLERPLDSRSLREGERISLTVVGPGPYEGATIDGVVGRRDAPGGGTSLAFDFDHIWLRNGRSGAFEGEIQTVRMPNGQPVRVDRSGAVRDRHRSSSQTVQSGAVGAAVGAIIGAIAGGGKGAAIGAVAGGAGMIVIENGRNDLNLPPGTEITVTAIATTVN